MEGKDHLLAHTDLAFDSQTPLRPYLKQIPPTIKNERKFRQLKWDQAYHTIAAFI